MAVLLLAIVLPVAFYIFLSSDWTQRRIRDVAQEEVSKLLGADVSIGHVELRPFSRLHLCEIELKDDHDSVACHIQKIEARIETFEFLLSHRLVVDYVTIDSLTGRIYRESPSSPLNIQGIISHLASQPKKSAESRIDLSLHSLSLRNAVFSYDILSEPATPGRFNPSHLHFSDIDLTAYAPKISNEAYTMELRHLSCSEASGLELQNLSFQFSLSPTELFLSDFEVSLPGSHIQLASLRAPLPRGIRSLPMLMSEIPVDVRILSGSEIYLPDLQAFSNELSKFPTSIGLRADATVARDSLILRSFSARTSDSGIEAMVSGNAYGLSNPDSLEFRDISFQIDAPAASLTTLAYNAGIKVAAPVAQTLSRLHKVQINGTADGTLTSGTSDITLSSSAGHVVFITDYHRRHENTYQLKGTAGVDFSKIDILFPHSDLSALVAQSNFTLLTGKAKPEGKGEILIDEIVLKGHRYQDILINADYSAGALIASATSGNQGADFDVQLALTPLSAREKELQLNAKINSFAPNALSLTSSLPGYSLSTSINSNLHIGNSADSHRHEEIFGNIDLKNFKFLNPVGDGVSMPSINIGIDTANPRGGLTIDSDLLSGEISGYLVPSTLVSDILEITHRCLPQLVPEASGSLNNNFNFDLTIDKASGLCHMLNLPIDIVHAVTLSGQVNADTGYASVAIDAPWLMQGDKVIENTSVSAFLNGATTQSSVYATTYMPTKKGPMSLIAHLDGHPGNVATAIDWEIHRAIPINGKIDFNTSFSRTDSGLFAVDLDMHPGTITFGQDVWQLAPSSIRYFDKNLTVNNFKLSTPTQEITVNTASSLSGDDNLVVSLSNVALIDIFETLEINNALIGGRATGQVMAADIFSGRPKIYSPGLNVKDISYNYCVLGDALVKMNFDNDKAAFVLDADIVNDQGLHSSIYGSITPATEQLDITFLADRVKVGFLRPFMSAFASDIKGYATGKAHLFGTFKYIDLEGDLFADSVQVKIDFTNTWYTATDSIRIRPGEINLKDIKITDVEGNTALLNGYVRHTFFSAPVFDFAITDADDFLCYNVTEKISPDWYGKIYGDGTAHVHGVPGVVDISVNMATRARSVFTFVLSDMEVADEFSFIEFRDVTPVAMIDSITEVSTIPKEVLDYRARQNQAGQDSPTAFNLDIQVDVTPQAQVVIVMDPVGGDRIRAYGNGNLRMTYGSVANDLRMYGTYTLERGDYNFTLQDIIIKDFMIQPGSSITFRGDPYSAQLDLQAVYAVNANLSDLDESFLSDKELNRTKVPVHALMKVSGDMRQPSIAFDLNFPTLTSDTYRKVRSIVSTDEMMNRQIIYLLALNKFYTPDYMSSTTRGNELFSVASATLGSQLSNMLGKLSDNWSIAPNLRSEKGDFSDIEVDLTLSSTLLNNRLLFNGNLGYRDKSLNTNRFVGDFDIEYLLNRRGTWRLKAYNRYNDQNYYLRTALTTQGIGIMYRRDFDKMFNFLKFLKPKRSENASEK